MIDTDTYIDNEDSLIKAVMSYDDEEVKLSMKVMINKDMTKVLFVEADNHFVDVLLSFLTLPLGKIVRILEKHNEEDEVVEVGSLTSLYRSIENLDDKHLSPKFYLLDPISSSQAECGKLKLDVEATEPAMNGCRKRTRSQTTKTMRKAKSTTTKASKTQAQATDDGDDDDVVFTKKTSSFIISDDLWIAPVVPGSILQALERVGVTDTDDIELRKVTFGLNKIKDLLRRALVSETPLTDIILKNRSKRDCIKWDFIPHTLERKRRPIHRCQKMFAKAMIQKSTNKLLIIQAKGDFIEFLCSLLVIPLGAIECLFGGKTCLKNVNNLYESVEIIDDKYLKDKNTKLMLLKPEIHWYNIPQCRILPLDEEGLISVEESLFVKYVKGQGIFNVTDDLTVTPFCLTTCVSVLSEMKIPLSDVYEVELQLGLEEAMNILKASLTSTSALTNGIIDPIVKKQLKQENLSRI